jgi:hypothetical protein
MQKVPRQRFRKLLMLKSRRQRRCSWLLRDNSSLIAERLACWNDVHQLTEYKAKLITLIINFSCSLTLVNLCVVAKGGQCVVELRPRHN